MSLAREEALRADARDIFDAALAAVEPSRLVVRAFGGLPTAIREALAMRKGRLVVIGAGKAAGAMAAALEDALADPKPPKDATGTRRGKVSPPPSVEGLVVVKHGTPLPRLRRIQVRTGEHPVPDAAGAAAAEEMIRLVAGLRERDVLFAVFSGGASALLPAPREGLTLADLAATTALLLRSGATIDEMNAVRKHLSRLAGGQLARMSGAAALIAFVISDVPGDRLDTVASGPTVPDDTTFADALAALERVKVLDQVPAAVRAVLEAGARGRLDETAKQGDPAFRRARTVIIGSSRTALEAAALRARERGYAPVILPDGISGEARAAGAAFAERLLGLGATRQPRALIAGGETTVKVTGTGHGGRNLELALGAAVRLAGRPRACVLAAGTDGEDGPTDAAGAVADGSSVPEATALGLDAAQALEANNSYPFFQRLDALIQTGPTGTNVMDLAIGLVT